MEKLRKHFTIFRSLLKSLAIKNLSLILVLLAGLFFLSQDVYSQTQVSVSFSDGFVGDEDKNNKAINCITHSTHNWTNIQFGVDVDKSLFEKP